MLQAASCRSTKVMALLAFSTTSITHSFNLATTGQSCSPQSPEEIRWESDKEGWWCRQRWNDSYDVVLDVSSHLCSQPE